MTLSDKRIIGHEETTEKMNYIYEEKDIKQFIKDLKEEIILNRRVEHTEGLFSDIDKLAGPKLVEDLE